MRKIEVPGVYTGIQCRIGIRMQADADFTGVAAGKKPDAIHDIRV